METALWQAIEHEEFRLYYQPKLSLRTHSFFFDIRNHIIGFSSVWSLNSRYSLESSSRVAASRRLAAHP